tara:strand:- start:963 stop:2231 length:1269 start_codon:yes stop_codon:yes gene_type:complete
MDVRVLFIFIFNLFFLENSRCNVKLDSLRNSNIIKSIIFKNIDEKYQFPIININEKFFLSFDDISNQDNDYYYKIFHYDYNWTKSKLFKNEYIHGFDNQRITEIKSSFGTKQTYTNYKLELPNGELKFLKTGNYKIKIFNSDDKLVFERKFLIVDQKIKISSKINRSNIINNIATHQRINFIIEPIDFFIQDPENQIKILIIQNFQWDKVINNIFPTFSINNQIHYVNNDFLEFEGGNEYYYFDNKDIRIENQNISYVSNDEKYETYLYTNIEKRLYPYAFDQDINGDFQISTTLGDNFEIEADYSYVHFSLAKNKYKDDESIYVYGNFNNYELSDENLMQFNPSLDLFEKRILLKQGFYNYKYILRKNDSIKKNLISGSHYRTENSYQILVYYKSPGSNFFSLIGFDNLNSFNINNSNLSR